MYTILYVLVLLNGQPMWQELDKFKSFSSCIEVQSIVESVQPGVILHCVEYREI